MFHKLLLRMSVNFMAVLMIVLLVLGKPLLEKLDRIKTKYGILDDGGKEA